MRVVMIGLVFAAIILAGGTAYLLRDYLSAQKAEFAAQVPKARTLKVLTASADLPIGTVINADNTQWLDWPEDGIQESYLLDSKDAKIQDKLKKTKHIVRRALAKGEPVTMARLYKTSDPGFLRGALGPGMRAIAVAGGAENASAGFILPGDKVDVMLTHTLLSAALQRAGKVVANKFKGGILHTSETILENIRVLAVDQNVNEFQGGAQIGKTLLLEVSSKDAEKLQTAKAMGRLSLVLRSAENALQKDNRLKFTTDVEVSPMLSHFDEFLRGFPKAPVRSAKGSNPRPQRTAPRPAVQRSAKIAAPVPQQITIFRGIAGTTGKTAP